MTTNETLDSILEGLYTGQTGEAGAGAPAAPAPAPAEPAETPAAPAKSEEDMSDEELALSVSVDPETEKPAEAPEERPGEEEKPAEPAPKKKTAEEIKKIREEAEADVRTLRKAFPELSGIRGLSELSDPGKYLSYRRKGLTPEEAYTLAYAGQRRQQAEGGTRKPQLRSSPTGGGTGDTVLTAKEAREFRDQTGLTDEEVRKYYRKF